MASEDTRGARCAECEAYFAANADALMHAAASVGIEAKLPTVEALAMYFRDFHRNDHVGADARKAAV